MEVIVIEEAGYKSAMLGLSLSYGIDPDAAYAVAKKLAPKDFGHNKFLESISIWFDITAPRFWWQEADTYRLSTKQSASTMHTIQKRYLTQEDFEFAIDVKQLHTVNRLIEIYKRTMDIDDLLQIKNTLPEGFLQRRVWKMSYKTLKNIITQRATHKLPQWKFFCEAALSMIEHPEFITQDRMCQDTLLKFPVF